MQREFRRSFIIFVLFLVFHHSNQSPGDNSLFYRKCLETCSIANCTDDGVHFVTNYPQPLSAKLLRWSCFEECRYECMWKTVSAFQKRNWTTYQFHGKWPFIRVLGLQEPASVSFSLLNLYVHMYMLRKFRKLVDASSQFYYMWHVYAAVCVNAWIWSTFFHARDTPLTEFMDYASAFSILMIALICMTIRILSNTVPRPVLIVILTFYGALFLNHVLYLSYGRFDYNYNMQLNLLIGVLTASGWYFWCMLKRKMQPYTWKCAAFVTLTGLATLLEIGDQPPLLFVVDFHAMWHLATAPLQVLFYNFLIDDCRHLKRISKEKIKSQ